MEGFEKHEEDTMPIAEFAEQKLRELIDQGDLDAIRLAMATKHQKLNITF